jgi:hypothetical protein
MASERYARAAARPRVRRSPEPQSANFRTTALNTSTFLRFDDVPIKALIAL